MKNIIATALVAIAATAGAASAMTPSSADLHQIRNYAPQADLSGLSAVDVHKLITIIQSSDNEGQKYTAVRGALN